MRCGEGGLQKRKGEKAAATRSPRQIEDRTRLPDVITRVRVATPPGECGQKFWALASICWVRLLAPRGSKPRATPGRGVAHGSTGLTGLTGPSGPVRPCGGAVGVGHRSASGSAPPDLTANEQPRQQTARARGKWAGNARHGSTKPRGTRASHAQFHSFPCVVDPAPVGKPQQAIKKWAPRFQSRPGCPVPDVIDSSGYASD